MPDTNPEKNIADPHEIVPPRPPEPEEISSRPETNLDSGEAAVMQVWLDAMAAAEEGKKKLAPEQETEESAESFEVEKNLEGLPAQIISEKDYQSLSEEDKEAYDKTTQEKLKGKTFSVTIHGRTTPGWKVVSYSKVRKKIIVERYNESGIFQESAQITAPQITVLDSSATILVQPEIKSVSSDASEAKDSMPVEEASLEEKGQSRSVETDKLARENEELKNRLAELEEKVGHLLQTESSLMAVTKELNEATEELDKEFTGIDDLREPKFKVGDLVDIGDRPNEKGWVVKKKKTLAGGGTAVVEQDGVIKHVKPEHIKSASEPILTPSVEMVNVPEDSSYDHINEIPTNRLDDPRIIRGRHGEIAFGVDEGGRPEKPNEDRVVINTDRDAFAVIDGMGGMGKGDQAAQILAEIIQKGFEHDIEMADVQKIAARHMNREGVGRGGACYIASKVLGSDLEIYQAGDVKLVVLSSDGAVRFETLDENLADEGQPHTVTNAVSGEYIRNNAGKYTTPLHRGDRIIAASDGIWDNFSAQEVAQMLTGKSLEGAMRNLNQALRYKMAHGGKKDNLSVVIYDVGTIDESGDMTGSNAEESIPEVSAEFKKELAAERNSFAEKIRLANKKNPTAARQVVAVEQAVEKALEEAVRSNESEKYEKIKSDLKELYTDPRTFLSDQGKIKKYGFS
jgi:serine/threonine protein phosphatase PrpC